MRLAPCLYFWKCITYSFPRHSHEMTKDTRPKDLEALETSEVANSALSFRGKEQLPLFLKPWVVEKQCGCIQVFSLLPSWTCPGNLHKQTQQPGASGF